MIFTFDDDAKQSYDLMSKYVSIAERVLKKIKRKKIKQIKEYNNLFKPHEISPILRGLLAETKNLKFIVNYRSNKILDYFINDKEVRRYTGLGTSTPYHVMRVTPFPLVIQPRTSATEEEFKKLTVK